MFYHGRSIETMRPSPDSLCFPSTSTTALQPDSSPSVSDLPSDTVAGPYEHSEIEDEAESEGEKSSSSSGLTDSAEEGVGVWIEGEQRKNGSLRVRSGGSGARLERMIGGPGMSQFGVGGGESEISVESQ